MEVLSVFFFFQAEDGIRDWSVTGVQTCALPIWAAAGAVPAEPHVNTAAGFLRRRRAALVADADRIGLDFIEVLADPADPGVRLLVLRFIPGDDADKQAAPARLRLENFRFTVGGVGGVAVDGLFDVELPSGGLATDPGRPEAVVRVRYAGDTDLARRLGSAPIFTLDLSGVPDLDPFFSRADFSLDPEV